MAKIMFKGQPVNTAGQLPAVGCMAPAFRLTNAELQDVGLEQLGAKRKILNIVPSLDTPVCAASARRFHEAVSDMADVALVNISADLPFAQQRFCASEGLQNIVSLSTMRAPDFGRDYGVAMLDGPLAGLMSRAVLVLDAGNRVLYVEQVPEIAQEPDYAAALAALQATA
ncbi:MAG: thiol peroxidase [Kiritimatiellia bacterium]|nr:thiol peroxidase [Lentisphaerota bacterium]